MEENSIIKDKKDKMLMIVIGCLSVVLILLFIFFLVERSENKKHIAAIHEEKQLLEQELTDLSHNYDDLKTSNDTLNEKLQLEQEKILTLMDQMKKFRDNSYAEINRYIKKCIEELCGTDRFSQSAESKTGKRKYGSTQTNELGQGTESET